MSTLSPSGHGNPATKYSSIQAYEDGSKAASNSAKLRGRAGNTPGMLSHLLSKSMLFESSIEDLYHEHEAKVVAPADDHDSLSYELLDVASPNTNGPRRYALYDVRIMDPVCHQLRLQLAEVGCPVVGDRYYNPDANLALRRNIFDPELERGMLQHLLPERDREIFAASASLQIKDAEAGQRTSVESEGFLKNTVEPESTLAYRGGTDDHENEDHGDFTLYGRNCRANNQAAHAVEEEADGLLLACDDEAWDSGMTSLALRHYCVRLKDPFRNAMIEASLREDQWNPVLTA
ncbi:unnamed protein product [Amoebophrya sp. A25]|nr:unnamed protein product [Amoebophrya sp. A25]|eukprot:GSA25T00000105001.1